ncbi:MAG: response regulator [Methanolinea sp.]|jgi:CheY-like chemotaxis protein|nr:response regulator [Methanolinea sp.]
MITVLFVDDEPALLDVSKLYLEKTGDIKIDTCYSAEQALECLGSRTYDAIVSDYEMPGMNGIAFLKTVRNLGIETPFIIFTGRGREQIVIEALNSGADFYLQKGGDPRSQFAELVHKIRLAVERFRREGALEVTRYSVERAGIPIFWFDSRGRVLYANSSGCALLGYSVQELCLLHISDIDPFFSLPEWSQFIERLKSHEKMELHLIMRTKGQQNLPLPVSFSHGEFRGKTIIFAYSYPQTGKERNDTWKKRMSSYQYMLADAIAGIYMEVTPAGEIIFQNSAARAFFGFCNPVETRTPCTLFDLTVKGQHRSLAEVLSRIRVAGEEELVELSLVRHDGTPCTFLFKTGVCPGPRGIDGTYFIEFIPHTTIQKGSRSS